MKHKSVNNITTLFLLAVMLCNCNSTYSQQKKLPSFKEYIKTHVATREEITVFLNDISWAKFDPEVGYTLGNYMPTDGVDKSATISTVQANGARKSFMYVNKPCRINTYGNSFTQCHQVNDGETWQEYLAAHIGEPVRNFGMGGYGAYQSYRRMLREEQTPSAAEYIIFYIWGDDHFRSLLRCRYMLMKNWINEQNEREGTGRMFHGNFWSNIEMDFTTGHLIEKPNRISTAEALYNMTDSNWMYKNLHDDLALQMALFSDNTINDIDVAKLKLLAKYLNYPSDIDKDQNLRSWVRALLDKYSFAASKYILNKAKAFAAGQNKKLMVVIFDPYRVTKPLLNTKNSKRYDQEIVNYLEAEKMNYFDMNLVHLKDFENFNLSTDDYFKRYFIGHYSPAGNHFFAMSIKPLLVKWLQPAPLNYLNPKERDIHFKGYLIQD